MGGLIFGLSRKTATEFSFFLAIPTFGAATVFQTSTRSVETAAMRPISPSSLVGFVSAFISSFRDA